MQEKKQHTSPRHFVIKHSCIFLLQL